MYRPTHTDRCAKKIFIICIWTTLLLVVLDARGQGDQGIRDAQAKIAATKTDDQLKKYRKFSDNDSIRWIYGGDATLNFAATYLFNWVNGGEDQIGVSSAVNLYANYKSGKRTLENYGTFAYGLLKRGTSKAVKNDDKLFLTSKAGYQLSKKWYYTAAFLARTQFAAGYKYDKSDTIRVSDFLAPINLYLSVGLDYRPSDKFSFVFSPVMGRAIYSRSNSMDVLSSAGLVEKAKDETGADILIPHNSRFEFGGGVLFNINGDVLKNRVKYSTQLELFSNYMEDPQNVDVTWGLQVKILVYKNISADLRLDIKYDDNQKTIDQDGNPQGAKLQVKNFFGVGLFYEF